MFSQRWKLNTTSLGLSISALLFAYFPSCNNSMNLTWIKIFNYFTMQLLNCLGNWRLHLRPLCWYEKMLTLWGGLCAETMKWHRGNTMDWRVNKRVHRCVCTERDWHIFAHIILNSGEYEDCITKVVWHFCTWSFLCEQKEVKAR